MRIPQRAVILATAAIALLALAASGVAAPASAATAARTAAADTAGVISTVAGGVGGPGPATNVALTPCGVAFGAGRVYIGSGESVRRVDPGTDWLTTPAGTGVTFPLGDGGSGTRASLAGACGTAVDAAGNLLIADGGDNRIRVVAASSGSFYGKPMTAGHIYTVAGDGAQGFSGDGGPATSASLWDPAGVAVDGAGNLLIADTNDSRIRVVAVSSGTFYGKAMTAGDIYTVAGGGTGGDGGPATSAGLNSPGGVVVDTAGNLLIADTNDSRIRVVAVSSGTFYGKAMTAGDIYTVAGNGTPGFAGDGGPATGAELDSPGGVAVDRAGNLLIADTDNQRIRVVAVSSGTFYGKPMTAGDIYTVAGNGRGVFAGDGGPATGAELSNPAGVAVDGAGNLLIANSGDDRFQVVAVTSGTFYRKAMTAGDIYTVAGNGRSMFSGETGRATRAELWRPQGVAVDAAGNLLISDTNNQRIRVAAAATGSFYGQAMTAGHIYTVAGDGYRGFAGDGGPATSAELGSPQGVAVDAAGNLLIADTLNQRIRVVAVSSGTFYGKPMTAGHIYTIAGDGTQGFAGDGGPATSAKLGSPQGVAVDAAGNLLIADTQNHRIRVVAVSSGTFYGRPMTAGDIYTIAGGGTGGDGGPATSARLGSPDGVAMDGAGNLLIADTDNQRIRVVAASSGTFYGKAMIAGDIYTVAGKGTAGFAGDGGPASSAELNYPEAVTADAAGNLLIADIDNNRVRVVAVSSGTFYGKAMIAGDIYTVAGNGAAGLAGDGGRATGAELDGPAAVAVDAAGNLLIADSANYRIRMVAG